MGLINEFRFLKLVLFGNIIDVKVILINR